jgi:hypothetical protein
VRNITFYLLAILILLKATDLSAQTCDSSLYDTKYRDYNTSYIKLKTISTGTKEAAEINKLILEQLKKLPNNRMLENNIQARADDGTAVVPDRVITGKIKKTIIKKESYAGNTGKDQYLIKIYETVFYEIEFELKDDSGNTLFSFKKRFKEDELKSQIKDFYGIIEKDYYCNPLQYCVKKEVVIPEQPWEYFADFYMVNGLPVNDYHDFIVYSAGAGTLFGIKGLGHVNSVFSVYIETAYNSTSNHDINYALTLQGGIGSGYSFAFTGFNVVPQISLGYIYSFYNVKYSDMESFYRNIVLRNAVEFNTVIFDKTLFIKPAVSFIFENNNTLFSIELLLGIRIKL